MNESQELAQPFQEVMQWEKIFEMISIMNNVDKIIAVSLSHLRNVTTCLSYFTKSETALLGST
jgi:hypothetical protein